MVGGLFELMLAPENIDAVNLLLKLEPTPTLLSGK